MLYMSAQSQKNTNNTNHHYSFVMSNSDQTTIRITKFLGKVASCHLHKKLRESMLNGSGADVTNIREQDENFYCTNSTKLVDKQLDFHPQCVRIQTIESLRDNPVERLYSIEIKICEIGDPLPYTFEQTPFKKIQKSKKVLIVADKTGAIELHVWESNFDQLQLDQSYQIKLAKIRIINNSEISLSTLAETSFIKIRDIGDVVREMNSSLQSISTCKGHIKSIKENHQEYACQACRNHEFTRESFSVACKSCNCRIANYDISTNESFEIIITTDTNEEYTLSIPKTIIETTLTSITDANEHSSNPSNNENWLNPLINLHVEAKFELPTAVVSELTLIPDTTLENKKTRHKNTRSTR